AMPGLVPLVAQVTVEGVAKGVGFAELITHPAHPRDHRVAELSRPAVHKDGQSRGFDRRLITTINDLADNWLLLWRVQLIAWATTSRRSGSMPASDSS